MTADAYAPSASAVPTQTEIPDPIDWALAERVAVRMSGRTDYSRTPAAVTMPNELDTLTDMAQELVEAFTGLTSQAGRARAEVIDRPRWIRANIAGFRHILGPIAERIAAASGEGLGVSGSGRARAFGMGLSAKLLGIELGVLLGFLSQRVLGQYDLLLPEEAAESEEHAQGGIVYYVGPNVLGLERTYGFSPRDFRLWIALHEVTHRTQFTAVPWLRPYFMSLVDEGLAAFDLDPQKLFDSVNAVIDRFRRGESPLGDDGLVGMFATPDQRVALDRMQGLMTLLEGHGNFVMDTVGADHVVGQDEMSRILRERRSQGGFARLMLRLMGMEMKTRQYEEGQRWINGVVDRVGLHGLDPAWAGETNLPTLDELRGDPAEWISRVGEGDTSDTSAEGVR